jgi:hypothetical protein
MILLVLAFLSSAHAEYRAFELVITNVASGQERVVVSTLDPNQYRVFYPVSLEEKVTYRATWKCKGNTSLKPVCGKPEMAPSLKTPAPAKPSLDQKSKS